ncbi:hypothetical protein ABQY58_016650 [Xanthomonas hortorum pv. hederae]
MLLIAVMVMLPVFDAFSCALEPASGHSTEMVVDDDANSSGERGDDAERPHGVCAHNHCHHSTALVPSNAAIGQDFFPKDALLAFQDDSRLSNVSDGLMRPPRI